LDNYSRWDAVRHLGAGLTVSCQFNEGALVFFFMLSYAWTIGLEKG
jgi:hypothetical protein